MKKTLSFVLAILTVFSLAVMIPFTASAEAGWDGTTATAPAGSGTKADPYLIESAANLLWMSKQVGNGAANEGDKINPFAGQYFRQVCDVDFNGKNFPSIGYYHGNGGNTSDSTTKYHVFGGHYDGQGYKISNGTVGNPNASHGANANWSEGIFGYIMGATIENVVLDKISLVDRDNFFHAGLLVGMAASRGSGEEADFNHIENCVILDTCSLSSDSAGFAAGTYVGGIVAYAYSTTVKNCVNKASGTVKDSENLGNLGGVVGCAEKNCQIIGCLNYGNLTVGSKSDGGIVCTLNNNSKMTNCVNYGKIAGAGWIGGVAAYGYQTSETSYCINRGTVNGSGNRTGGVVCHLTVNAKVHHCVNEGEVKADAGKQYIGGVVCSAEAASATIENCVNAGKLTGSGSTAIGGIVSYSKGTAGNVIKNNINTGDITAGTGYAAGIVNSLSDTVAATLSGNINMGNISSANECNIAPICAYATGYAHVFKNNVASGTVTSTATNSALAAICGYINHATPVFTDNLVNATLVNAGSGVKMQAAIYLTNGKTVTASNVTGNKASSAYTQTVIDRAGGSVTATSKYLDTVAVTVAEDIDTLVANAVSALKTSIGVGTDALNAEKITAGIEAAIAGALIDANIKAAYVQTRTSDGALRFVVELKLDDPTNIPYDAVGFRMTATKEDGTNSEQTFVTTMKLYKTITAGGESVTAADGYYFAAIVVKNIPTGASIKVTPVYSVDGGQTAGQTYRYVA